MNRLKVDRRAPHKPNACLGSSHTSSVPKRDQTLLIFRAEPPDCLPASSFAYASSVTDLLADKSAAGTPSDGNFPGKIYLVLRAMQSKYMGHSGRFGQLLQY